MAESPSLPQVKKLALRLPLRDKIRLIEWIAAQSEHDLQAEPIRARKSLRGLWRNIEIDDNDIDQARTEMWADFPRKDI